jgi:hypothetical protein
MTNNKELNHKERAHAPFGGSVAARRINCTGSYFLESQLPPQPASAAADEGTEAHECVEWALADFLYRKIEGEGIDLVKPVHFNKYAQFAEDYVDTVWTKALHSSITGKSYAIETIVTINESLGMYGPCDFACVYSDERGRSCAIVIDYKHGYNFVPVEKNDQLAHYACGLREDVRRAGKDLEYIRAAIYQPRAGGETYREVTFTAKFLDSWKKRAIKAAEQIFVSKKAKFKCGEWCKFCRAKPVCKAYAKQRTIETQLNLVDHATIELPKVDMLSPEHIVKLVLHGDKLIDLVETAKKIAFDGCAANGEFHGLKLVEGRGKRGWDKGQDEDEIATQMKQHGIKTPYKESLRGITEIEKELKKLKPEAQAKELMDCWTTKSVPKILVDSTDPRPAVACAKDMLEAIGD